MAQSPQILQQHDGVGAALCGPGIEMEPHTIASALIVLGDGFFAAMVRSVVAGVQLFAGPKHPWKVFGDVDVGLVWAIAELEKHRKTAVLEDLRACARTLLDGRGDVAMQQTKRAS
ncbi:MAG: hypothetical protein Q8O67_18775 [Deltaproteobacteria bacterium]|nr:hypothetical protein [Deltaproteobacteria bacterium]